MRASQGSFHLGPKKEEERLGTFLEPGDTVSVKEVMHIWNDPKPVDPGSPHIDEGRAEIEAGHKRRFCMLYLGDDRVGKPLTQESIEKMLNKLGWFRRDNG